MANKIDYYSILGLSPHASKSEIRKAYLEAIKLTHPDKTNDVAGTRYFDIQQAFNILHNEENRIEYDSEYQADTPDFDLFQPDLLLSRNTLLILDEPQLLYAMVNLLPILNAAKDSMVPSFNLCLVIDVSSSMKGYKLEETKKLCFKLSKALNPTDIFSIVTFNDFADVVIQAQTPKNDKILNKIQLMNAGGGTEIFTGLQAGFNEVQKYQGEERHNQIILLTDGHTYGDEEKCVELSRAAAEQNIFINCYGIGPDWNDKFLDKIAVNTGGHCEFIPYGLDYHEQIISDIDKITSARSTNIKLSISNQNQCSIRSVHRMQPNQAQLPSLASINIGQIPEQGPVSLLFEILLEPNTRLSNPHHLLDMHFVMAGTFKHKVKKEYSINLIVPLSTNPINDAPPAPILRALEKLQMVKIQEKARQDVLAGDTDNAISQLNKLTSILEKNGNHDLAKTVNYEILNLRNTQKFSDEGDKRIKYGTRALNMREISSE